MLWFYDRLQRQQGWAGAAPAFPALRSRTFSFPTAYYAANVPTESRAAEQTLGAASNTHAMPTAKQALSDARLTFAVRKASLKKYEKERSGSWGSQGSSSRSTTEFWWPGTSCLFPARLSNSSVGGAEEKYVKDWEVFGYRNTQEL